MSRIILSHLDINTVKDPEDSKVLASLDKIPFFKDFLNKTIIPLRESYNEVSDCFSREMVFCMSQI